MEIWRKQHKACKFSFDRTQIKWFSVHMKYDVLKLNTWDGRMIDCMIWFLGLVQTVQWVPSVELNDTACFRFYRGEKQGPG